MSIVALTFSWLSKKTQPQERSTAYEHALREKSRIIRQTEMENMNVGKKKNRSKFTRNTICAAWNWDIRHTDLQTFREALAVLQRQVEELDEMRLAHYQEVMEHEEEVWDIVQGKVRSAYGKSNVKFVKKPL